VLAIDATARQRLLSLRESLPELLVRDGTVHKLDVGLPLPALATFCERLPGVVERHAETARLIVFGHLGDGNLHINILGLPAAHHEVDASVLELVVAHGGTISAEHGIGMLKARYLSLARSPSELRVMRLLKGALDPLWILNPGVVLEKAPD
jgi:FAD/FMN-containing dehydrogenase